MRSRACEGRGLLGCLAVIVAFGLAIFLGIKLAPIYYANFNFKADVKTEIGQAGAHSLDNETVIKALLELAKKDGIQLTREGIRLERFAGQVHVDVRYSVLVDFGILQHDLDFEIKGSSFLGTL